LDAITDSGTQLVVLVWIGILATAWLLLNRERNPRDRRPPIVAVQKHGRVYYVRKDVLDASESADQANHSLNHDRPARSHRPTDQNARDTRQHIAYATVLAVVISLLTGVALFGQ
jgi:hypothetical protein